ncbi:PREDICTED: cytochrome b5 [Dufourea novaeangliae]|uniref:Cytochrome b5 n=1 Tax=Dufourea novaeangliae TaxID=178035 RepID=A0A154PN23_DUFNO|nr:PREDICTED: cytochrome b5 [Dufourea novaeangliae]KZC13281.1 Cytochrome b5 [Dufourea novaeangliae]
MASENTTAADTAPTKLYTRKEVAEHTDSNDLWIIINNKIYNLSSFLSEHPGGEEVLLEQGGQDGTQPFEDIGHSSDARQMMESYKIGELVEEERTKGNASGSSALYGEDNSSGSWRSWLIPIALGVLATLVYRYFIKAH